MRSAGCASWTLFPMTIGAAGRVVPDEADSAVLDTLATARVRAASTDSIDSALWKKLPREQRARVGAV